MKPFSAIPATEYFHVKQPVEDGVPDAALGVAHVNGKALRAADVFAGGFLFHERIRDILPLQGGGGNRR
jgi:hypothetical protein